MTEQPPDIELGQLAFGNPWGEHECPAWVDALVRDILSEIERVFWNINQRQWDNFEDPKMPGIEYRSYYWGSDEAEAAKPNFRHTCTVGDRVLDIEVRWYKHPMRGSSLNVPADPAVIIPWFEPVLAAIRGAENGEP